MELIVGTQVATKLRAAHATGRMSAAARNVAVTVRAARIATIAASGTNQANAIGRISVAHPVRSPAATAHRSEPSCSKRYVQKNAAAIAAAARTSAMY